MFSGRQEIANICKPSTGQMDCRLAGIIRACRGADLLPDAVEAQGSSLFIDWAQLRMRKKRERKRERVYTGDRLG